MKRYIGVAIAWVSLSASAAGAQPAFDAVQRLHEQALRPAMQALATSDLSEARRLARVLLAEFEKLPPQLQIGQVGDVQRLSRMYMEQGLFAEADLLLTRAASTWATPMMETPGSPLGPLYADLAKARRLSGRPADAEALLRRAQALRGSEPTQTDPDAFPIFVELAELRRARGDIDSAEKLLRRMVEFSDRMNGWEYVPNLIAVFEAYAAILEQSGRTADARQFRARAATIRKNYQLPLV